MVMKFFDIKVGSFERLYEDNSLKESRPYLWLILTDPSGQYDETGRDVARWAFDVLYSRDENFGAWLESLGFDP